jgi:hypothetical protein
VSRRLHPLRRPGNHTFDTVLADQNGLGGRHLGLGLSLSAACLVLYLFGRFLWEWFVQPVPWQSVSAWLLLVVLGVLAHTTSRSLATTMPTWLFSAVLAGSGLVVVLDLIGCWGLASQGIHPTAAPAVGALLMSLVTRRPSRQILIAAGALGAALSVAIIAEDRGDNLLTLAPGILTIALSVIPPGVGVAVARAFRRMVTRELDLVLVQSTVSQPRFAVGMLASEELARLDLDAETLLDDVAQGRTPLPLSAQTANTAASLATQLRLHLIEGQTETWLHHAVTESAFLGPAVTLIDSTGLAGLLSPIQRDALLLTIWLLVGNTAGATTVKVTLGPITPLHGVTTYQKVRFPIRVTTTGVRRRRVDPETWQAIRMVGPHVDSNPEGSLRVDIECSVDNPADA